MDIDPVRSPGLQFNLSSNNPFRNRTASSAALSNSQPSPSLDAPRPVSRNPFLDPAAEQSQPSTYSHTSTNSLDNMSAVRPRNALAGSAAEIFVRDSMRNMKLVHPL